MKKKIEELYIGSVAVDSGTILVGDPCYWLTEKDYEKELLNSNFDKFYDKFRQVKFELGHFGKGVIVTSGYGDGCYHVFAKIKNDRIKEITVKFF